MANAEFLRNASLGMLTASEKNTMRQRKKSRINSAASPANGGAESISSTTSSSCGTPSEASSAKRFRLQSDVQHFVDLRSERMEGHRLLVQSKEERTATD